MGFFVSSIKQSKVSIWESNRRFEACQSVVSGHHNVVALRMPHHLPCELRMHDKMSQTTLGGRNVRSKIPIYESISSYKKERFREISTLHFSVNLASPRRLYHRLHIFFRKELFCWAKLRQFTRNPKCRSQFIMVSCGSGFYFPRHFKMPAAMISFTNLERSASKDFRFAGT